MRIPKRKSNTHRDNIKDKTKRESQRIWRQYTEKNDDMPEAHGKSSSVVVLFIFFLFFSYAAVVFFLFCFTLLNHRNKCDMNELVSSIDRTKLVTVEQLTDDIVAYRSQVVPRHTTHNTSTTLTFNRSHIHRVMPYINTQTRTFSLWLYQPCCMKLSCCHECACVLAWHNQTLACQCVCMYCMLSLSSFVVYVLAFGDALIRATDRQVWFWLNVWNVSCAVFCAYLTDKLSSISNCTT